ncbi:phosphatidylserine/phosphatidylglycerophosphate/cardiolipin synthase-like enzyme [Nakamurella sp. UYEF19]|uniref:DISARM system phospholipase D-like protein DrmC n=1 Tax=Nakamurella sp. UYEF19 TaxID=1756392 RepID=UPI00339B9288
MTAAAVIAVAVRLSRELPRGDVQHIAAALLAPHGLSKLQATAAHRVRDACAQLRELHLDDVDRPLAAGALLGALEPDPDLTTVTSVWTGPVTTAATRLTSAVVVDLISQAAEDVLLVGYAVHNEPTVAQALHDARARGVTVTLVLERQADNDHFKGLADPFPGLDAIRLCWPADVRPPGASLHAKLLVIDDHSALVGSANITGAALGKNLECGLLVRGIDTALSLRQHVASLVAEKHLKLTVN